MIFKKAFTIGMVSFLLSMVCFSHAAENQMKKTNYPKEIPVYIYWTFDKNASADFDTFIKTVQAERDEISKAMGFVERIFYNFSSTKLSATLPFKKAKFRYDYAVQLPNHEWQDHIGEIVIEQEDKITFGQLLYALHHNSNGNLFDIDIMAIEGMELDEALSSEDLPVYHLWFGD